jgi:LuxR family quorum sensing-dependent transcriptional regulator
MEHAALLRVLPTLATQYDIFRFLKTVTESFGLRSFLIFRLPDATTRSIHSLLIISSWPAELVSRYDQAGMISSSPVTRRLKGSTVPFTADLEVKAHEDATWVELLALLAPFEMQRLAIFPVSDPDGQRGAVGFHGSRPLLSHQEMLELTMLSICAFDRLYQLARQDHKVGEDLTEREIDCLNWTAAGKTSVEISEILGLSEHTINHYLNRATRKLDTVNRTQAVAKAIRTGIIS